jgi:DNA-binding NtrC family response regulator
MRELATKIRQVAPTHATVLIRGESGTGKELVARAIHELSGVRKDTFLALNCAAIPGHLLESELFGHERGSFTGAVARQAGKFELANGGTLFLDEIGELASDLQAKILRVLEARHFMRVGGQAPVPFDARLLAATNRDLQADARAGRFREDLYYRLNVVAIDVPALRERGDDVQLLAIRFLRDFGARYGKHGMGFSPEALAALQRCRWAGNVRELRNVVESLVVLSRSGTVDLSDLPPAYRQGPEAAGVLPPGAHAGAEEASAAGESPKTMRDIERDAILQALREAGGNRDRAARQLGIGKRTLQRKIKEYREEGVDI